MKATVKGNNHNRVFKYVAAKANPGKLCDCLGSQPGKVKIDIDQHLAGCHFRTRSRRYASKTSAIPNRIVDGFSLGIVVFGEDV